MRERAAGARRAPTEGTVNPSSFREAVEAIREAMGAPPRRRRFFASHSAMANSNSAPVLRVGIPKIPRNRANFYQISREVRPDRAGVSEKVSENRVWRSLSVVMARSRDPR